MPPQWLSCWEGRAPVAVGQQGEVWPGWSAELRPCGVVAIQMGEGWGWVREKRRRWKSLIDARTVCIILERNDDLCRRPFSSIKMSFMFSEWCNTQYMQRLLGDGSSRWLISIAVVQLLCFVEFFFNIISHLMTYIRLKPWFKTFILYFIINLTQAAPQLHSKLQAAHQSLSLQNKSEKQQIWTL